MSERSWPADILECPPLRSLRKAGSGRHLRKAFTIFAMSVYMYVYIYTDTYASVHNTTPQTKGLPEVCNLHPITFASAAIGADVAVGFDIKRSNSCSVCAFRDWNAKGRLAPEGHGCNRPLFWKSGFTGALGQSCRPLVPWCMTPMPAFLYTSALEKISGKKVQQLQQPPCKHE